LVVSSAYQNGTDDGTNDGRPHNHRGKFEAKMLAKLDTYQEEMDAWLEDIKDGRKEMTACPEVTGA
jgi:hypothetical protein